MWFRDLTNAMEERALLGISPRNCRFEVHCIDIPDLFVFRIVTLLCLVCTTVPFHGELACVGDWLHTYQLSRRPFDNFRTKLILITNLFIDFVAAFSSTSCWSLTIRKRIIRKVKHQPSKIRTSKIPPSKKSTSKKEHQLQEYQPQTLTQAICSQRCRAEFHQFHKRKTPKPQNTYGLLYYTSFPAFNPRKYQIFNRRSSQPTTYST